MLYVIIVTYNGEKYIKKCLDCIFSSSIIPKVIVVDNASQDSTVKIIKENYEDVILFESQKNLGFGQANNLGINHALDKSADNVFLLNQDAYLKKDCLENLLKAASQNKDYGIISPLHLHKKDTFDFGFLRYLSSNRSFLEDLFFERVQSLYQVKKVNAAAWLLTKKCLERIGGFDPLFFHYGEDSDYCQRVKYKNIKIGISPRGRVYHDRPQGNLKDTNSNFDNYDRRLRSELYYLKNLDRRFIGVLWERLLSLFFESLMNVGRLQSVNRIVLPIRLCVAILFRTKDIRKSRRISRSNNFAFLSLK